MIAVAKHTQDGFIKGCMYKFKYRPNYRKSFSIYVGGGWIKTNRRFFDIIKTDEQ